MQIRKTHFPPRPQLRKTRSSPAKFRSSPSSRGNFQHASTLNGGRSSSSGSDTDDPTMEGSTSPHLNRRNRNRTHPPKINTKRKNHADRRKENSAGESGPASQSDIAADSDYEPGQPSRSEDRLKVSPIRNKFLANVCDVVAVGGRAPPDHLNIATTQDSGFQSSCGSSADMSPDVAPLGLARSSQETYCSDLEDHSSLLSATPLASTVGTTSTVSNLSTTSSSLTANHAIRCISSCSTQNASSDVLAGRINRKRSFSDTESGSSLAPKTPRLQEHADMDSSASTIVPGTPEGAAAAAAANGIDSSYGLCMMCLSQPKNGVFVHSRFLHLCCCYRCAVKVWNKQKRCPICNCKIKNVMKLFVH